MSKPKQMKPPQVPIDGLEGASRDELLRQLRTLREAFLRVAVTAKIAGFREAAQFLRDPPAIEGRARPEGNAEKALIRSLAAELEEHADSLRPRDPPREREAIAPPLSAEQIDRVRSELGLFTGKDAWRNDPKSGWWGGHDSRQNPTEERARCGLNCDCCVYDDGTAPNDHSYACVVAMTDRDASCSCGYTEAVWFVGVLFAALTGWDFVLVRADLKSD